MRKKSERKERENEEGKEKSQKKRGGLREIKEGTKE